VGERFWAAGHFFSKFQFKYAKRTLLFSRGNQLNQEKKKVVMVSITYSSLSQWKTKAKQQ
jgi:hypothetical protein